MAILTLRDGHFDFADGQIDHRELQSDFQRPHLSYLPSLYFEGREIVLGTAEGCALLWNCKKGRSNYGKSSASSARISVR